MLRRLLFAGLFCFACAISAQVASDPFTSSTTKGRTWTNTFFGITWEMPKDLQTNLDRQAQAQKAGREELVERMRADDRQRGVMLSGSNLPVTTQLFDQRSTDPTSGSGGIFSARRSGTALGGAPGAAPGNPSAQDTSYFGQDPRTEHSYWIMTKALTDPAPPLASLIEAAAANLRQQPGGSDVQVASEPVQFGGQEFRQTDWTRQQQALMGKYIMYSRAYSMVRNGYEITFSFRADSKRALQSLARSMESLKFQPPN